MQWGGEGRGKSSESPSRSGEQGTKPNFSSSFAPLPFSDHTPLPFHPSIDLLLAIQLKPLHRGRQFGAGGGAKMGHRKGLQRQNNSKTSLKTQTDLLPCCQCPGRLLKTQIPAPNLAHACAAGNKHKSFALVSSRGNLQSATA